MAQIVLIRLINFNSGNTCNAAKCLIRNLNPKLETQDFKIHRSSCKVLNVCHTSLLTLTLVLAY